MTCSKFTGLLFTNDYVMVKKAKPPIQWQGKDWRDVVWYEWIYEINELWQVRSYWKNSNRENSIASEPQKCLKQSGYTSKKGAPMRATVQLYNWLKIRKFKVARLMARAFLWMTKEQYENIRCQVIHLNWDQMDCRLENLKISNPSERTLNHLRRKKG